MLLDNGNSNFRLTLTGTVWVSQIRKVSNTYVNTVNKKFEEKMK